MDFDEPDIKEYEDRYYRELITSKLRVSDSFFLCPFCDREKKRVYHFKELLEHASDIYTGSRTRTEDKEKHLALERYLGKQFSEKNRTEESSVRVQHPTSNDEQAFVWPPMAVLANIQTEHRDSNNIAESGRKIRESLMEKGFKHRQVVPLWNQRGHSGFAIVKFKNDFESDWTAFANAMSFETVYQSQGCGKTDYYRGKSSGDKLYGWVARADDYNSKNLIGDYLKKKGDLKTVAEKQEEERRYDVMLESSLKTTLGVKSSHLQRMKSQYDLIDRPLRCLIAQTEEMLKAPNEELKKMQLLARNNFLKIFLEYERAAKKLQAQQKELQQQESELELREFQDESERIKLRLEKESIERAVLEQNKADEKVLRLAEAHEREKEKLQEELDNEQALQLQIDEELKAKEEEYEQMKAMKQALTVQEGKINDELQGARKELITYLKTKPSARASIGIKRMGELDREPFQLAAKRKYAKEGAEIKALELCSLWQEYVEDPMWHPFKTIVDGDKCWEFVDEEDEKLKVLRDEHGYEVFEAVKTALKQIKEYNPSGGSDIVPEMWNFEERRKASLKEGVALILNQWRTRKRKRK